MLKFRKDIEKGRFRMEKDNRIVRVANKAKLLGFKYMASVVASYYNTKYYNVVIIDEILDKGKWLKDGEFKRCNGYLRFSQLPKGTIMKKSAMRGFVNETV